MSAEVHIAIGSNLQPHVHVPAALGRLNNVFGFVKASPFYETPAIDRPDQPNYWNGVVRLQNRLPRGVIEARLRGIEEAEGRRRTSDKWAARTLDLDIVGWHGEFSAEVTERPFLARCIADLGDLPANIPTPRRAWPVAWRFQPNGAQAEP